MAPKERLQHVSDEGNLSRLVYRIGTHMSLHILTSEHSKYSVIDSSGENAQWLIYIHLVNTLIGQEKIHSPSKQGRDEGMGIYMLVLHRMSL